MKQNTALLAEQGTHADIALTSNDNTVENNNSFNSKHRNEDNPQNHLSTISLKNKLLSILCGIICITTWISNAHIIKDIQDVSNDEQYDKPFFLMWMSGVTYILLFIPWYLVETYSNSQTKHYSKMDNDYSNSDSYCKRFKQLSLPAMLLGLINLFVEFTWAVSLNDTMVSVNTAIYQSEVALVYILSIIFLGMKVTLQKTLSVVICVVGIVTIAIGEHITYTYTDEDVTYNSINGIIMLIISVFLEAILIVGIEYVSDKYFNKSNDMIFLQSLMGFFILFTTWPIFFIFDKLNVEKFELPSTGNQWIVSVLSMILNVAFFGALFMGIHLTNAVFMAIVILFVLPVGYFSDVIIYEYVGSIWAYIGTSLIIIGFLMMELPIFDYIKRLCFSEGSSK
eukprot:439160_1